MIGAFYVALLLTAAEGLEANWGHLRSPTESWSCLPAESSCSSSQGPLSCCFGKCCYYGKCRSCEAKDDRLFDSPVASFQDSLFTDFVGRQFEFTASQEEYFSLITEADHQVNALLIPGPDRPQELGVTFRGVGVHGADTSIKVTAGRDGRLDVVVNGRPFKGSQLRLDGVTVMEGCTQQCNSLTASSSAVTIKDKFMTLCIWPQPEAQSFALLNFQACVAANPMSQVHGILGQTLGSHGSFVTAAPDTRVALPTNLQFYGEGQPSDYSTTDLFSSDSTFSVFTRKAERRRHHRKRQMMEGNALASMALASRTSRSGHASGRSFPQRSQ